MEFTEVERVGKVIAKGGKNRYEREGGPDKTFIRELQKG